VSIGAYLKGCLSVYLGSLWTSHELFLGGFNSRIFTVKLHRGSHQNSPQA